MRNKAVKLAHDLGCSSEFIQYLQKCKINTLKQRYHSLLHCNQFSHL